MTRTNRQWILRRRPVGDISPGDLELVESAVPDLQDGQVLVRNVYLSLDPTNRIWMSDIDQYMPPVGVGDVMRGATLGIVEESRSTDYAVGDALMCFEGWQDWVVTGGGQKLAPGVPLTAYLSAFGATGATAYFGLLEVGQAKAGETVVVSAAAGAVGSVVGQIAKLKGCRVVGFAGSDAKCAYVVDTLGFDACINYRTEDLDAALKQHCPDGIDVDFENAGGPILDAVMNNLAMNARIVVCGLIDQYNATGPVRGPDLTNVLMKRARIEGFIILDFLGRFGEFYAEMGPWLAEGKVVYDTTIVPGLENAVEALDLLFTGGNTGKLLVQVSPEP